MTTPESNRQAPRQQERIDWRITPVQRRHIQRLESKADAAMENLYRLILDLPRD